MRSTAARSRACIWGADADHGTSPPAAPVRTPAISRATVVCQSGSVSDRGDTPAASAAAAAPPGKRDRGRFGRPIALSHAVRRLDCDAFHVIGMHHDFRRAVEIPYALRLPRIRGDGPRLKDGEGSHRRSRWVRALQRKAAVQHPRASAPTGENAERGLRQADLRFDMGHHGIAMQHQLATAPERQPPQGRDDGDRRQPQALIDPLPAFQKGVERVGTIHEVQEMPEVHTGRKGPAGVAGDDKGAKLASGPVERCLENVEGLGPDDTPSWRSTGRSRLRRQHPRDVPSGCPAKRVAV